MNADREGGGEGGRLTASTQLRLGSYCVRSDCSPPTQFFNTVAMCVKKTQQNLSSVRRELRIGAATVGNIRSARLIRTRPVL